MYPLLEGLLLQGFALTATVLTILALLLPKFPINYIDEKKSKPRQFKKPVKTT
jgi:hypothetical protein